MGVDNKRLRGSIVFAFQTTEPDSKHQGRAAKRSSIQRFSSVWINFSYGRVDLSLHFLEHQVLINLIRNRSLC